MEKILLINNDYDLLQLLQTWLINKAYQVKITTSNKDITGLVRKFKPKLIIADILQNEAVDAIKADSHTKNLPVLLMTGYADIAKNLSYNADDFIAKPFNLRLLEVKMKRLLNRIN